jgi:hypothetical protein
MGKSIRNTNSDGIDVADQVAQSLGMAPKQKEEGPKKPIKQKSIETSDAVAQSLGLKKKVGGDDSGQDAVPTPSESTLAVQGGDMFGGAMKAYQDRTLNKQNVDVLAQTDAGKKMGLDKLSPDAREVFAHAHNGLKKSDLVNSVTGIIDNFYPQSQDPKLNQKRFEIKQSVLQGNQDAILRLKSNIVQSLQKQIDQRESEISGNASGDPEGYQAQQYFVDRDAKIQALRAQQRQVSSVVDEYGKQSLVSSKDMEAWLKLDSDHPNIQTSIAAEKLGKMSEEKYGAERATPNQEHDRMAAGFRLIMQSLQMDINQELAFGIPLKNPELLKKAQDKVATLARYKAMYDKLDTEQFPDVGLDKTARYLADIIAEKHPNKLIRTKADVTEAGNIAEERNPGYLQKFGKFVQAAAQKQDQGTFIPRGGGIVNEFVGGVVQSAAKSAIDLLKWRANVFGYESDKEELAGKEVSPAMRGTTQSRTEQTTITYDKEGKAYREMPNENYGTLPWNNFFRFAGSSLPGLAEFIASEGVGKAASSIATADKISKSGRELSGLIAATYITSYNSNREFADANIDDKSGTGEAKKIILANFLTMANAGVFHALNASPSKMVEKAISKAVAPDVMKLFEENSWEQLNQKTASSFLKDKILPRAKAIVEKFGEAVKGGVKMGTASVIDEKMHDLAGLMTNSDFKPSTIEDNARSFVQQALLMTMVGGVAGMISTGEVPHATKEALHQAGLYAPQYIDQINERVQNGELDPHKANGMIAMIKTMGEELGKASQETTADGTPLTVHQQRDIAIANFRKRAAAQMEENGLPVSKEKVASEADSEIKNIRAQNNWQAIEETPTFKSIKTVAGEGEKSEKVKAM